MPLSLLLSAAVTRHVSLVCAYPVIAYYRPTRPTYQGESLLPGSEAMHSWAGSLERFLAEFCHGRGLGILHPNLNGAVSFARQVPSGGAAREEGRVEEDGSAHTEGSSTPTPALRGGEEEERPPETLVRTFKDAQYARVSGFCLPTGGWMDALKPHACALLL